MFKTVKIILGLFLEKFGIDFSIFSQKLIWNLIEIALNVEIIWDKTYF